MTAAPLRAPRLPAPDVPLASTSVHTPEGGIVLDAVAERRDAATAVVHLRGELCPFAAPALEGDLRALIDRDDVRRLAVDARRLDLLTAAGITVLLTVNHRAEAAGGGVWITRPSPATRRVVELCGLDWLLVEPHRRTA